MSEPRGVGTESDGEGTCTFSAAFRSVEATGVSATLDAAGVFGSALGVVFLGTAAGAAGDTFLDATTGDVLLEVAATDDEPFLDDTTGDVLPTSAVGDSSGATLGLLEGGLSRDEAVGCIHRGSFFGSVAGAVGGGSCDCFAGTDRACGVIRALGVRSGLGCLTGRVSIVVCC